MPAKKVKKFERHTKAKKTDPVFGALCGIEAELQAHRTLLREILDASKSHVELKADTEMVKHGLLNKLVDGQKVLAETIMLLTAKGITKAPKEKKVEPATPQQIVEGVNPAGREMAQAQRNQLATPAPAPEEKKPTLSVVPSVAPSGVTSPGPSGSPESFKAPTLDELRTSFLNFIAKNNREAGVALLQSFGAAKLTDVPLAQYPRFAAACASF